MILTLVFFKCVIKQIISNNKKMRDAQQICIKSIKKINSNSCKSQFYDCR